MKVVGPRMLVRKVGAFTAAQGRIEVVRLDPSPTNWAIVVAIGTHKGKPLPDVQVGDKLVIKEHCGTPARINDEELYFISYDDALGVVIL